MRLFLVFFLLLTDLAALAASPFPPIGRDREEFERSIRATYGLTPQTNVREFGFYQEKILLDLLKTAPESEDFLRDLADVYHTLGHMEEYDDNFESAVQYQEKAFSYFNRTRLKSKQTRDKTRHSIEHIFIDIFEHAYQSWQKKELQHEFLFRKALQWARRWDFASSPLMLSPPVRERYLNLILRAPGLMIQPTLDELNLDGDSCESQLKD